MKGTPLYAGIVLLCVASACSDSATSDEVQPTQQPGGAVSGPEDTHCSTDAGLASQATDESTCAADHGHDMGEAEEYDAPLYNAAGNDGECKYHVKWSSTPIYRDKDVRFTIEVSKLATIGRSDRPEGDWATGADPHVEVTLGDTHPAPPTSVTTVETSPGIYEIGPIRFDQPGQWTVRFHLWGECQDATESSPHAHIAFYVSVH